MEFSLFVCFVQMRQTHVSKVQTFHGVSKFILAFPGGAEAI
jgi:hypothetical protein